MANIKSIKRPADLSSKELLLSKLIYNAILH